MGPNLGEIEGVVRRFLRIRLGHYLNAEAPLGKFLALDRLEQIALVSFAILAYELGRFAVGEELVSNYQTKNLRKKVAQKSLRECYFFIIIARSSESA